MVARQRVTVLQQLMKQRRLTREQTLDVLNRRARTLGVRDFALSLRQLDRWLAGDLGTEPRPSTTRVVEAEFGRSIDELLRVKDKGQQPVNQGTRQPSDMLDAAAYDSVKFTVWADSVRIGELSLAALKARLAALAGDYVNSPLVPVFSKLVELRDDVVNLITNRPDPARLTDAYRLAGTTYAMLAYASGDLGSPHAAMSQAQAALACAERADSPTLTAWILGNQAMTCEWYGRPGESLRLAAHAAIHAQRAVIPGTVLVRLAAIEARAHARMGKVEAARDALDRARAARDAVDARYSDGADEFDDIGGILTFTLAKQYFYSGSTYLRIGDASASEAAALAAIRAYSCGPAEQRSYGDEALAWVDVAAARAAERPHSDLDGAFEALQVVSGLPPTMRIPALVQPLSELRRSTGAPRYRCSPVATRLQDSIDDLVADCRRGTKPEITT